MSKGVKGRISFGMKIGRTAAVQCAVLLMALSAEIVFAYRSDISADIGGDIPEQNTEEQMQEEINRESAVEEKADSSCLQDEEAPGETEIIRYVSELGAPEGIVEPAKIVWEEVPVELTEKEFTFGGLHLILPVECSLDYQERKDKAISVCLLSEEEPFKKICFTHYRVDWDSKWELILAAMEFCERGQREAECFSLRTKEGTRQDVFGVSGYSEGEENHFYMLVRDDEMYLLESSVFRFEELCQEGRLQWEDLGGWIQIKEENSIRCQDEKGQAYLLAEYRESDGSDRLIIYRDRHFDKPAQILEGRLYVEGDINFDGYTDVSIFDEERKERDYLLWDDAKGQFVKASVPESIGYDKERCDEFQTIWDYDIEYGVWETVEETERLYRWEGITLKEIRSITCQIKEEDVRITLTDAESRESLAFGVFPKKGWEQNPEVRKLYGKFYDGYAPEELYHICHAAAGKEEYIPESLVQALSRELLKGTQDEFVKTLETGRKLSEDEVEEAALKSADIARIRESLGDGFSNYVEMMRADLDNDGWEDIFSEESAGGTGGFRDFKVYQGNEDGEYSYTGRGSCDYNWQHTIIGWEGKNFICRDEVDYDKRRLSGLVLEGYQEGRLAEIVRLDLVPERQEVSVVFCQDGYREPAEKVKQAVPGIYEKTEKYEIIVGDAERKSEDEEEKNIFWSDIDNDKVMERYKKSVWLPSTMSTVEHLEFEMEENCEEGTEEREEGKEDAVGAMLSDGCDRLGANAWIMLWVDAYDGKNIVNVMYRIGLYDCVVEGYLLQGDGNYSILYTVENKTELSIEEIRDWKYRRQ